MKFTNLLLVLAISALMVACKSKEDKPTVTGDDPTVTTDPGSTDTPKGGDLSAFRSFFVTACADEAKKDPTAASMMDVDGYCDCAADAVLDNMSAEELMEFADVGDNMAAMSKLMENEEVMGKIMECAMSHMNMGN